MNRSFKEKRLNPRLDQKLPLNVVANGFDFSTSTKNVSCCGAYCHIDKYVPPFTRVFVKLSLPVGTKTGKKNNLDVECKGVVVRTEDEQHGGFNVAIFFNGINDVSKQKITRYISQYIPQ